MPCKYFVAILFGNLLLSASLCCRSALSQEVHTVTAGPGFDRVYPNSSADELEARADSLRAAKRYFDATDYYRAALAKEPSNSVLYNKLGIDELLLLHLRQAKADFEHAIKLDPHYAAAYNNLGVVEYSLRKYGRAIKEYHKAITLVQDQAVYYSNLGTAYFSKKQWLNASHAYNQAIALDPNIFQVTNQMGVAGQIASPEDRAHFSYVLAELFAKKGMADRSLECLRRAFEEGYKGVNEVYSDAAFTELRKDPRFVQLLTSRPVSIPE
jgi:tetratricopeptide (TPR) repeat protein